MKGETKMNMNALKKALIKGIPAGLGLSALYVTFRLLLNGGTIESHLFSTYGILTMICLPIAWVAIFFCKEKEKALTKA